MDTFIYIYTYQIVVFVMVFKIVGYEERFLYISLDTSKLYITIWIYDIGLDFCSKVLTGGDSFIANVKIIP